MGAPCYVRPIGELKPVFLTPTSRFSLRRPRGMVFGGPLAQVLALLTVNACLWLVWMLKKKTAKVPSFMPELSTFWSMV